MVRDDHLVLEFQRHTIILEQLGRQEQGQTIRPLEPEIATGDEPGRRLQQLGGGVLRITGLYKPLLRLGDSILETDRIFLCLFAPGTVCRQVQRNAGPLPSFGQRPEIIDLEQPHSHGGQHSSPHAIPSMRLSLTLPEE